jgi:hypothetical protein
MATSGQLLVALTACGGGTRQLSPSGNRSFRAAVEQEAGQPAANWPAVVRTGRDICEQEGNAFKATLAAVADTDTSGEFGSSSVTCAPTAPVTSPTRRSSLKLAKVPRRIAWQVMIPKNTSTRFSHRSCDDRLKPPPPEN